MTENNDSTSKEDSHLEPDGSSEKERQKSISVTRRGALQKSGVAGLLGTLGFTQSVGAENGITGNKSPTAAEELDEENVKKLRKELRKNKKETDASVDKTHKEKLSGVSTQDVIGSIPSIGKNESYATQSANWEAGDYKFDIPPAFAEYDTKTSGVVNKAFAGAYINYIGADNPWAWAETGLRFDVKDSGRFEVSSRGQYAGELVASGTAASEIEFNIHLIDLTDEEEVLRLRIWNQGSLIVPIPGQTRDEAYRISGEADLTADHSYLLVPRVRTSAVVIGTGSAQSNAWTGRWNFDGFFQWFNLSLSWLG
ncbi:hypothetical protein [Halonotius pteroides]|uniref:hypothetical protein n=1 Tax=Halonotius pteroides TaxID=268735 RepID=UPI001058C64C|nr:hypothetical protein [Halonotius pteroides]